MSSPLHALVHDILHPLVTEQIQALVRARLLEGLKFFEGHTLRSEFSRGQAKLVLLLVRTVNPKELLSADEEKLVAGGSRQMHRSADNGQSSAQKAQKSAHAKKHKK